MPNKPEKYKIQPPPKGNGQLPMPYNSSLAFSQSEKQKGLYNIGLYFDRYIQFADSNWQMDYELPKHRNPSKTDKYNAKIWNLQKIAKTQIERNQKWDGSLFEQAVNRWKKTVKSQHATPFKMSPTWRFVVGLGDKTALEVGFTFHRIYGFPIIPGSALKGLARTVALWEIAETLGVPRLSLSQVKELGDKKKTPLQELDDWLLKSDEEMVQQKKFDLDEAKKDRVNRFRRIFGTQHAAGEALFFESVPAVAPALEVDVMTVHYPDYYSEQIEQASTPPADNQNPNPISFLTVGQMPFWFAVGWRDKTVDKQLLDRAVAWLTTALKDFGIGAKTAAGYGYFEEVS